MYTPGNDHGWLCGWHGSVRMTCSEYRTGGAIHFHSFRESIWNGTTEDPPPSGGRTFAVKERAATVARIDGGIGLDDSSAGRCGVGHRCFSQWVADPPSSASAKRNYPGGATSQKHVKHLTTHFIPQYAALRTSLTLESPAFLVAAGCR